MGIVGALPGGDITRVIGRNRYARGILPKESIVTGQPVSVVQRGRGAMIKGSNVATWS